jgi:hypothetical protein
VFGGTRSSLTYMSYRNGLVNLLPTETNITYILRRRSDGIEYAITLPIVARIDRSCLAVSPGGTEDYADNERVEWTYPGKISLFPF